MEGKMEDHLQATAFCDWQAPEILGLAEEICQGAFTEKERALRIFSFIRDEIYFGINNMKTKATGVLRLRTGECGTKTNLQIALLRAVGIPARFRITRCKSEALRGIVPDWLANRMPPAVSHFWCECFLEGRWVSCEAMLDRPLYESLLEKGQIKLEEIPTIDWDGESDLTVMKPWIVEERGALASYDDIYEMMDKSRGEEGIPPRIVERLFGWMIYWYLRRYTDKVRKRR
ncbi:MAG: transglutaminase-like domain-containing protein [Candidatus Thorarchaeota archaeon]|jgi:transglutaminase-like putative cysteine protease